MKRWTMVIILGWSLFAISYLFPAGRGGDTLADGVLPGWETVRGAFSFAGTFGILSSLTNLLMLSTLLILWIRDRRIVVALLFAIAASTLLNAWWLVSAEPSGDLFVGYYLWLVSFAVVAGGFSIRLRDLGNLRTT